MNSSIKLNKSAERVVIKRVVIKRVVIKRVVIKRVVIKRVVIKRVTLEFLIRNTILISPLSGKGSCLGMQKESLMGSTANTQCPICRAGDIDKHWVNGNSYYQCNTCGERWK
jgi:hypothetical protein